MRTCIKCCEQKEETSFYSSETKLITNTCKKCILLMRSNAKGLDSKRRYRKSYKGILNGLRFHLRKKYNLSITDYFDILEIQQYTCKICKKQNGNRKLAVDHCHMINKVRGLLCTSCNIALGSFQDNIKYLQNAIKYLKDFEKLEGNICLY